MRFYQRDTAEVAREMLGALLVRRVGDDSLIGRIVETEAYYGKEDPASHAFRGPTPRSAVMFGPPGRAYVYFSYGMHHLLNVVTEEPGKAGAVLVRALEPIQGIERMSRLRRVRRVTELTSGPAKLTQAMSIDLRLNGAALTGPEIFLCRGEAPPGAIDVSSRVGISAGRDLQLRFSIRGNPFVSR